MDLVVDSSGNFPLTATQNPIEYQHPHQKIKLGSKKRATFIVGIKTVLLSTLLLLLLLLKKKTRKKLNKREGRLHPAPTLSLNQSAPPLPSAAASNQQLATAAPAAAASPPFRGHRKHAQCQHVRTAVQVACLITPSPGCFYPLMPVVVYLHSMQLQV